MPSVEVKPLVADPVTLEDVERELYALTGWQEPQAAIDAVLDVVRRFAAATRRGVVPLDRVLGHGTVAACTREHLEEHTCPVIVKTEPVVAIQMEPRPPVTEAERSITEIPPLPPLALDEPEPVVAEPTSVRRNEPALTIEQLLVMEPEQLRPAQRVARAVLLAGEQRCGGCGVVKPLDKFYKDNAKLTRRMSKCSECSNKASMARRAARGR